MCYVSYNDVCYGHDIVYDGGLVQEKVLCILALCFGLLREGGSGAWCMDLLSLEKIYFGAWCMRSAKICTINII